MLPPCKVKVKDVLVCAKQAQRGTRGIALTLLNASNKSG